MAAPLAGAPADLALVHGNIITEDRRGERQPGRQIAVDERTGVLGVGKSADIAVWDRDPLSVPTGALKDTACEMTLFEGKVVHDRQDARNRP